MTRSWSSISGKTSLAALVLLAATLAPGKSDATLLGSPSVFGCVAIGATCDLNAATNIFGADGVPVTGGVEFDGNGEFPNNFSLSADLGTNAGSDDFIAISFTNFGVFPLPALTWEFSNLTWVGDPTGIVAGITLDSSIMMPHPHVANVSATSDNAVVIQTLPLPAGTTTLRFFLTTAAGPGDGEVELPAPAPLLTLLLGLPLVLLRRLQR